MSEVNSIIKGGINTFKDQLTTSKSFKKFKNKATKFGETGQFNVKDFSNLGKPLMKDFKKSGKNAALQTLKGLTGMLEGNRTKYKGVGLSGSGNKKDMSKGPNEKVGVDYRWIQAKDNKKKEVISSSYEIEEGVGKVIRQVVKSPGVRRFVSNLSKSSKVKIVSKPVITPGSTLGSKGKFAANHFDKVPTGAGSSYVPKHVRYLDDMMDKSKRGLTGHAGAKGFPTPDSKSVKVYKQPSYANPKYPGDKTGAYARELARQDNTARIGKNSSINKDGISNKGYYNPDGRNTVGGKVRLKPSKGLEDKNIEFLKKMKNESYNHYSWRDSFTPTEIESFDIIKPEPLVSEGKKKGLDGKACWKGYKLDGTKKKDGKTVDNCVKVDEGVAGAVLKVPGVKKTIAKVGGAVLAAKGGEKILKDLLGTPSRPKATDWDKNPKDKIDQELNVKQGQAKDAAKNKPFDKEMKAFRKGKKNLTDEDKIKRLKDAAAKYRGKKK